MSRSVKQTPQQIVDRVLEMAEGDAVPGAGPGDPGAQGRVRRSLRRPADQGLQPGPGRRHRSTPLTDPAQAEEAGRSTRIEVVVDRLTVRDRRASSGITDSIETALRPGRRPGRARLRRPGRGRPQERRFSERLACPNDMPLAFDDLEPRSFSFNSPFGACPDLHRHRHPQGGRPGAGRSRSRAVAERRARSRPWSTGQTSEYFLRLLQGVADEPRGSTWTPRGRTCRRGRRSSCCTACPTRCT